MSYIKRKRDRRDYELRRLFEQFARMPQRIVTPMPAMPGNYNPSRDRVWTIPDWPPMTFEMPQWGGR